MKHAGEFFAWAREREAIRRRRAAGQPWPWTDDPALRDYRITNVFREYDKTTTWFREHVRSKLGGLAVVEAVVAFRWFNRIETGARVLDLLLHGWDASEARRRLTGIEPVVTGAYVIKTPDGRSKLEGVLWCIESARARLPMLVPTPATSRRQVWGSLQAIPYVGVFMAGEIVEDLTHTDVLREATDIDTWVAAGPGCARGLGWVVRDDPRTYNYNNRTDQAEMCAAMQELLRLSRSETYWPQAWDRWRLHSAEFWACEVDKIRRARNGERPKRRYAPPTQDVLWK